MIQSFLVMIVYNVNQVTQFFTDSADLVFGTRVEENFA